MDRLLMKSKIIIAMVFLCFFLFLSSCTAKNIGTNSSTINANDITQKSDLSLEEGMHSVFNGAIDNKTIKIDIYRSGNILTAYYVAGDSDTETELNGKIDGNNITLTQTNNGKTTASLEGSAGTNKDIQGTYKNLANNTQSFFRFSFDHVGSDNMFKRYVGFDNNDVEKFVANLKKTVIANDITAISKMVSYPITIYGNDKKITANDANEVIARGSEIITPEFRASFSNSFTKFMFTNLRGVMFGDGQFKFWIDQNSNTGEIRIYTIDIR